MATRSSSYQQLNEDLGNTDLSGFRNLTGLAGYEATLHKPYKYNMVSKLSRYCQQLLEAGWLASVVIIPLYFNIYSDRVFEADKTFVLRTIALLMAAAWGGMMVEQLAGEKGKWLAPAGIRHYFRQNPVALLLLLLILVYLLSTLLSVTPRISWFGSYRRLQGSSTLLAYAVICLLTLSYLRTTTQRERLITTLILTSVPVTLYAIVQRLNADPIPWGQGWQVRVQLRVVGQLGHPIFVAAYLMMIFPLTLGRIGQLVSILAGRNGKRLALIGLYGLIGLLQLLTIYWSGSRGPLLGLLVGLFIFGLVWFQRWRRTPAGRRLWVAGIGLSVFLLLSLLLLSLPGDSLTVYRENPLVGGAVTALERLKATPAIGRFGQLLESGSGSGRVRVLIWEGMVELIGPHRPLTYADGRPDSLNALRWLVGYGPDELSLVYPPFFRPEIATIETRDSNVDRAHNESLDLLAMTGLVGFIAWQLLWFYLLYVALRGLALTPAGWLPLAICWFGGGLGLGGLALGLNPAYVGLAYPAGNLLGLVIYLVYQALYGVGEWAKTRPEQWLLMGLLAGLVAHYLEIQIGIAIVTTRLLFFMAAALIVCLAAPAPVTEAAVESLKPRKKPGRVEAEPSRLAPVWIALLILGLMLAITAQTFVLVPAGYNVLPDSALQTNLDLVQLSFFSRNGQSSPYIFGLLTLIWLIGLTLFSLELGLWDGLAPGRSRWGLLLLALLLPATLAGGFWLGLLLVGGIVFLFYGTDDRAWVPAGLLAVVPYGLALLAAFSQASALYAASFAPSQEILESPLLLAISQASRPATFITLSFGLFAAFIFLVALALGWPSGGKWATRPGGIVALGLVALAIFVANRFNIRPAQADTIYKQGKTIDNEAYANRDPAGLDQAIAIYQRALELSPAEDLYFMSLGLAYLQKASITADPAGQAQLWQTSQTILNQTQNLSPLDPTYALTLARLNVTQARLSPADQAQALAQATTAYEIATRLNPQNGATWNEYANFLFRDLHNCQLAQTAYQQSNEIDPFYINTYFDLARLTLDCDDGQTIAAYQQAKAILWAVWERLPTTSTPRAWERLAQSYPNVDQFNAALAAYNEARAQSAAQLKQFLTQADESLAAGDLAQTEALLQQALALTPNLIDQ